MTTPKYSFALREDLKEDKRFLPTKAEPKATGWDVRAAMPDKAPLIIKPFEHVKIPLGFRAFCPNGWWFELKPRSSTFAKKNLHALYGTIDETYEGEAVFAAQYIPHLDYTNAPPRNFFEIMGSDYNWQSADWASFVSSNELVIHFGDAIGQIIPIERQEMEVVECSNEEYDNNCKTRAGARGAGGFGSTGK